MKITEIPAKPQEEKTIRVAAYARVSSDKDAAFHSLEAQQAYYEEYIKKHPNWKLVDIYSDNGISGTIINRPEFQRMLEDCRNGKIDLVVTKSITRFARNTVILLETVRELKALDIDVFFEKENMHSISPDGELMLTLLAMHAEEEARSASENQKWRIRKKFENGEPWVGDMLGYRLIDGKMVVVPEEAEIVKMIFNDYLSGMGITAIAKKLNDEKIPPRYSDYWQPNVISSILRNEKYAGNLLLQKTFRPDFRTKRHKTNNGEIRRYFIEHSHEPIIEQSIFNAVNDEIKRRQEAYCKTMDNSRNKQMGYLFSGILRCGLCGYTFRRRYSNSSSHGKPVWICKTFFDFGKSFCDSQQVPEEILIKKTKEVLRTNTLNRKIILEHISEIEVTGHFHLRYTLTDNSVQYVVWEHKSRKESWTPEMKEKARQKALQRNAERRRNE
ncbi:MAG: recombinase family protein [Ruminococcus sp.]|nr:recombinase family protein [Ruminococcus sp.]